jgi:hypothetical protein
VPLYPHSFPLFFHWLSRPLTNFPLFFSFFSFLLFIFGLSRGFPVNWLGELQCWVGLGWIGSAFFSCWLNLASWLFFFFFFKMANFYTFLIWFSRLPNFLVLKEQRQIYLLGSSI